MKKNRILLIVSLLALSLILSACGSRIGASSWPGISVDGETVYLAYNQFVYALSANGGEEIWRFPEESQRGTTFYARPALTEDGQLLVGGYDNVLYSLDPQDNGRVNWQFEGARNRFVGSPLAAAHGVYASNADQSLYALTASGDLRWEFQSDKPQWAQPVANGETVYLPAMDHHVYALDSASGDLLWSQDLGGTIVGTPALSPHGVLYVGSFGSEVVALDTRSGDILWRTRTDDWVWGGPTLVEGRLYVADLGGVLYALDAENGDVLWRLETDGAITASPLVWEGAVYVGTEGGEVLAVDAEDGSTRWTRDIEGQLYSSPAAAGDLILVGVVDGETLLVALQADNGAQQWSFAPEE